MTHRILPGPKFWQDITYGEHCVLCVCGQRSVVVRGVRVARTAECRGNGWHTYGKLFHGAAAPVNSHRSASGSLTARA